MAEQFPPEVLVFESTLKTVRGDSHACLSAKGNLSLLLLPSCAHSNVASKVRKKPREKEGEQRIGRLEFNC